jgi:hypothetical protein
MHIDEERKLNAKSELRQMLGVYGIAGVLELLAEVCQDFGEGSVGGRNSIDPDAFWLEASAYVDRAKDELKSLLRREL